MRDVESLIRRIHDSPYRAVLVVTGGGASGIADLLSVPGASRTVLEALIPYGQAALEDFLGFRPRHFVSTETAVALARKARARALTLWPPAAAGEEANLLGVGCTAALRTERPKKGEHRAHIAVQPSAVGAAVVWSVVLSKGARERRGEEEVVGDLLIRALATECGLSPPPTDLLLRGEEVTTTSERSAK
jgi:hypothetical protein